MSESINKNEPVRQPISPQASAVNEVQEAMQRLRICPRQALGSLSHLRIDRARVKPINSQAPRIGGKADVEAAILASNQSSGCSESDVTEYVALKKLRFDIETDDDRVLAPFAREVSLLNDLSHDNVVKIIGFVEDVDNGVAWMVFAWEKNGNLREFVRSAKWELPELVSLAHDVAKGLRYLHGRNPPICHGDLKSLNILVNSKNRAIVTDFGSARFVHLKANAAVHNANGDEVMTIQPRTSTGIPVTEPLKTEVAASGESITMTGPAWTIRWAAPELSGGALSGLGSDIWAFGWICWETITSNFPFDGENEVGAVIWRIVTRNLPTVRNDGQLLQIKALCTLMEECWRLDADQRPTAVRCQQALSFMHQTVPSDIGENDGATTRSSELLEALGWIQLNNGMLSQAQEYFRQSLDAAKSVGDEHGQAGALVAIAEVYCRQSRFSDAKESLLQSGDLYHKIGNEIGVARVIKDFGEVFQMQNELSNAVWPLIQSRDLFSKLGHQLGFVESVRALGYVYFLQDEFSKAEKLYIQSRDLCSKMGNQLGFAKAVQGLGELYLIRREWSKAEEALIQSRDLFSKLGEPIGFASSLQELGEVYRGRKEYFKAEEWFIQSREVYSEFGSQLGVAKSVKALGSMYLKQKEYSKAEESYVQSRNLYAEIGDQLGVAEVAQGLGEVYRMQNEYSKAEESFIQSRDAYSQIGNQLGWAKSVKSLGDVYVLQKEISKAEESFIQSRDLYSKIGDQDGFAESLRVLGYVLALQGKYTKARESFFEARQVFHRIGDLFSLAITLFHQGWMHLTQKQYAEAERLLRDASPLFGELGKTKWVALCHTYLAEVRRENSSIVAVYVIFV